MANHSEKILLLRGAISASAIKIQMDLDTIRDPEASESTKQFLLGDVYRLAQAIHEHIEQIDCHLEAIISLEAERNQEEKK